MYNTLVVVDSDEAFVNTDQLNIISFEDYLAEYPKLNEPKTRVINLCDTEHYLSRGYYCSLLAEARQHHVLPSVSTINDLRDLATVGDDSTITFSLDLSKLQLSQGTSIVMRVFFGWLADKSWQKLAKQVFERYPAPILQLCLLNDKQGVRLRIERLAYHHLTESEQRLFAEQLEEFTTRVWRSRTAPKRQRWDLAILVDPEEKYPPSDKDALKRFVKAAAKVGIHAELVTAPQAAQIAQYDALFIRETTAIDHHSYRLARKAEQEGVVVIDDPTSILRCCNKVFLHDAFTYNRVPALKTHVVINTSDAQLDELENHFHYPMVLKMPEGSFSKGVFKVSDRSALRQQLTDLLADTALVLVQEYLYTEFDWRIGVLNGRAIYACRYHMARNHWQIYNHQAKRFSSGGFETLPTFEVPKAVLDAALKAANMIGTGLYGVDLKQTERHVYVIEVNDNPSIDHGIEDAYLGNELYMLIMSEFAQRLERRGKP